MNASPPSCKRCRTKTPLPPKPFCGSCWQYMQAAFFDDWQRIGLPLARKVQR